MLKEFIFQSRSNKKRTTGGFVLVMVTIVIVILMMLTAFVADYGRALYEQRRIAIATDAASIAALNVLGPTTSFGAVQAEVNSIVTANGVLPTEVTEIRCGTYIGGVFTPQAAGVCDSSSTAVRVLGQRVMPTIFGRIFGVNELVPNVQAVSYQNPGSAGNCIRPMGIEYNPISPPNTYIGDNMPFTIGTNGQGNWGPIEFYHPQNWRNLMLGGEYCSPNINVNSMMEVDTGVNAVKTTFQQLINVPIVVALTTQFPNGGSGQVEILQFARVKVTAVHEQGNNLTLDMMMLNRPYDASDNSTPPGPRQLVK